MLVEHVELQLVRPPVPVRRAAAGGGAASPVHDRASAFVHDSLLRMYLWFQTVPETAPAAANPATGASVDIAIIRV